MAIKDYVLNEKDYIVSLRRHFHENPEESLKEYDTAAKIEDELNKLGIPCKRVGDTGVLGIIKGELKGNEVIVLRADIDGLKVNDWKDEEYKSKRDGLMHACGHDGHAASLLGAAKILNERKSILGGEVRLFFQQAEEIGQGAKIFINEGCLEGAHSIFGVHVASDIPVGKAAITEGPICASCDYFKIKVKGRSAHVSKPHLAVDALYIASQIVVSVQGIVSRNTDPVDTVVVGIGTMKAGTIYNAVAGEAVLEGTTRAFTKESRERVNNSIVTIAKNIGEMYNAEVEVEFKDYASPLINDSKVCSNVKKVAEKIIGSENIVKDYPKKLGADDFADYLTLIPGTYAQVGTKNIENPNTGVSHHNEFFDIDEDGLLVAANLEVDYVLSRLSSINIIS